MAVSQRMETDALRQTETSALQGHRGGDRIRLERRAIGIREYQVEISAIAGTELSAEFILSLAVAIEGVERSPTNQLLRAISLKFVALVP